jgi:hypothetical protein
MSSMLLLAGGAAGVTAMHAGKLPDSQWGTLQALLHPPAEAVCDGLIVGATTGLTKAIAQGVNLMAPNATAAC